MCARSAGGQRGDAQRERAHPDRGRQGRPGRPGNQGIDGVQRAEDVAGPYDVIARVQAPGMKEFGSARIQGVDGVTRTLTCTTIRW